MMVGTVATGKGIASEVMADVDRDVWQSTLGYVPVSGTLNLQVDRQTFKTLRRLATVQGPTMNRYPDYVPVEVAGIRGHIRFSKSSRTVEMVAPVRLRHAAGLEDGDQVEIVPCR